MILKIEIPIKYPDFLDTQIKTIDKYIECNSFPSKDELINLALKWIEEHKENASYFNSLQEYKDKRILHFFKTMELPKSFPECMSYTTCKGEVLGYIPLQYAIITKLEVSKIPNG